MRILKGLIYLAILVSLLYAEDYHRGFMYLMGIIAILIALLLAYLTDKKQKHIISLGIIVSVSGFLALGVGVHVKKDCENIEITSVHENPLTIL